MEFDVKVWKSLQWKKRKLIIGEKDFKIKNISKNHKTEIKDYSLINAYILDQSKKNDLQLLIITKSYKKHIKPKNPNEKKTIIEEIEKIIKKNTFEDAFSQEYKKYNKQASNYNEDETNPHDLLCYRLFMFQNLMQELNQQLENFKEIITEKFKSSSGLRSLQGKLLAIKEEMDKQFQQIVKNLQKNYELAKKNKNNYRMSVGTMNSFIASVNVENNQKDSESSSEEDNIPKNNKKENDKNEIFNDNLNKINVINENNKNNKFGFLSNNESDFYNENYNFDKERKTLPEKIKCPSNLVKEMINTMTQKTPAPVYFNEPLSMCQKQCEKFYYLDLLTKASNENNKSLQLGFISAFIIGELFLYIGRNLKPFNPIIGETFEYFDNKKKFRYYSEQISHSPQITAFVGETTDFALYGDTENSTSFKILKGAIELEFKNKIHLILKKCNNAHFIYNRPTLIVKGFVKPPLHNDFSGTTVIENINDKENKCEIKFYEETWKNNVIGLFDGKIFNKDKIVYLIKGNWNNNIYLTDPDGNNKIELLNINQKQEYLKNNTDSYALPEFSCNLNVINEKLENNLPHNDSRFRKDMRNLENGEIKEAQVYKEKYEEKQRKELNCPEHEILYFEEYFDEDIKEKYYKPNGKYWNMKKNNVIKSNKNAEIFDVGKY